MTEPLRPFERRYTPDQARAVTYAMVDHKPRMTATQAVRAAAEGKLPGSDLPPFGKGADEHGKIEPIPTATAYAWRRAELDARSVKAGGRLARSTDADHAARLVLTAAWDDLEKCMKTARNLKISPIQRMKTVRAYAETAMYLRKCEADLGLAPKPRPRDDTPLTTRNSDAEALARAARTRARTEHHEPATPQGDSPATGSGSGPDSIARQRNATPGGLVSSHLGQGG